MVSGWSCGDSRLGVTRARAARGEQPGGVWARGARSEERQEGRGAGLAAPQPQPPTPPDAPQTRDPRRGGARRPPRPAPPPQPPGPSGRAGGTRAQPGMLGGGQDGASGRPRSQPRAGTELAGGGGRASGQPAPAGPEPGAPLRAGTVAPALSSPSGLLPTSRGVAPGNGAYRRRRETHLPRT